MVTKVRVRIKSVAFKGTGVARVQGKVVFVPFTMTGDEAWVEMVEEKKRYSMGKLIQITEPSPWRVTPLCLSFGTCGGCQWQHIDYSAQGRLKEEILKEGLMRLGGGEGNPSHKGFSFTQILCLSGQGSIEGSRKSIRLLSEKIASYGGDRGLSDRPPSH